MLMQKYGHRDCKEVCAANKLHTCRPGQLTDIPRETLGAGKANMCVQQRIMALSTVCMS